MTGVPLAVAFALTSRQRPEGPLMGPLELKGQRWFVPPLQSQIWTLLPAVAFAGASRPLPRACTAWPLSVQRWFAPPLQSQMMGWVPLAVLLFGTSRQRPDAALTSVTVSGGGVVPV